jgi:hypothetical protein
VENEVIVSNYQNKYLKSTPLYTDMGGGENLRVSPPELKVNQSLVSKNIIYNAASGALIPRDGTLKLLSTALSVFAGEETNGIFHANFSTGRRLVVTSDTHIYMWDPNTLTWVDKTNGLTRVAPTGKRVRFAFYNDTLIGCDGTNAPFKMDNTYTVTLLGGTPPVCKFVTVWNDYIFMFGDGTNKAYFSDRGNSESWPSGNFETVGGAIDGDAGMGLAVAYGNLIFFKRNSVHALSGTSTDTFAQTQIGRSIGLVSEGCHANADNDVWFLGPSGLYLIGSDLRPQYMSDYVLLRYQQAISNLRSDNSNLPSIVYNPIKQQVWISLDVNGDAKHDKVMVHDLINKDASGRPAVSEYVFYDGGTDATNINPKILGQYLNTNNDISIMSVNRNNYVYEHDVPWYDGATGDDGHAVQWTWQSKYLNLGDPMRLKSLRFYTVMGESRAGTPAATGRNYAYDTVSGSYAIDTPMTYARRGCMVASVGGKVYSFGGYDGTLTVAYTEEFDPATNLWTTKTAMPAATAYGVAVASGTKVYVIGGYNTETLQYSKKVYIYDTVAGTWSTGADMTTARMWLGADVVSGVIYCIGGYAGASALAKVEAYDIAGNSWTTKTDMTTARYLLTASAVGAKIYAIGGFPFAQKEKNEEYDTAGNTWATKTPLVIGRYEHFASVVGSDIFIFGGYSSGGLQDAVKYTPGSDSYTVLSDLPAPRYWGAAATNGTKIYVVGGNGLPATITFISTNDFTNLYSVALDLTLNSRRSVPASATVQRRFYSVSFSANICEGITTLSGWNLDYTMFQRRN